MSKRIEKIMNKYSNRDLSALKSIYDFRCLSFLQLYNLHYKSSELRKSEVSTEYLRKKIIKFKRDEFIEEYQVFDKELAMVYCLTPDGIKAVKTYFNIPDNIYDSDKKIAKRGYYTYSEVKVAPRFLAHQFNLNEFSLGATALMNELGIDYRYTDERYIPDTNAIRPDAIISLSDANIFLEMDMGSESLSQLEQKWDHYRTYLNANGADKKIIILFICKNKCRMEERINLIKHSINQHFVDCFSYNIELYVNTSEKLLGIFKSVVLPLALTNNNGYLVKLANYFKSSGFNIASGKQISQHINNLEYRFYIKDKASKEFIVSDFFGEPISTIHRMSYHSANSSIWNRNFKRDISLIVCGITENQILAAANIFEIPYNESVFFTTLNRLETLPFNEALFRPYSNQTDIYCFEPDFKTIKPSKKLSK